MSKTDKPNGIAPSMIGMLQTMQDAGIPTLPGIGTDWMEMMTNINREMLEFTTARIKEDAQTQNDLLQAKGFDDVQKIQTQFFQKAMDDYTAESAKLMDMVKTAAPKDKSDALPV
jgi:hypothetical protein